MAGRRNRVVNTRRVKNESFNFELLAASLSAGLIAWAICWPLYSLMVFSVPRTVVMGIMFLILIIIILATVFILSHQMGTNENTNIAILLTAALTAFLLTLLFQWLYGMGADNTRDLLSAREARGFISIVLGILRVVFLTVIGVAIGVAVAESYGREEAKELIYIGSAVKSFIAAVLIEFGTISLPETSAKMGIIFWILTAATFTTKLPSSRKKRVRKSL